MKTNQKTIKVIIAVMIILGGSFLVINTIRPHYYEGANLEFPLDDGPIRVTNSSDALPVQLISTSSRTFRVSSPSEDISGVSVRQDSGSETMQIFEFVLPSGTSEFTVSKDISVSFKADTTVTLEATVYQLSNEKMRFRIIALIVLALAILFYISRLYDHNWVSAARRQDAKDDIVAQKAEQANFDQIMQNRSTNKRP